MDSPSGKEVNQGRGGHSKVQRSSFLELTEKSYTIRKLYNQRTFLIQTEKSVPSQ